MKKILSLLSFSMFTVNLAEAETDQTTLPVDDGITQKWELKTTIGAMLTNYEGSSSTAGNINWGESLQYELGVGYNFNSHLFFGLSSGYFYSYGLTSGIHKNNQLIPFLGDVVYRWNPWERWSLFAEARAGYLFNLLDTQKLYDGSTYDPSGYALLEIMPGVYYRLQNNIDIRFSLGFTYGISTEPKDLDLTNNEAGFVFKLGFNIRNSPKQTTRSELED